MRKVREIGYRETLWWSVRMVAEFLDVSVQRVRKLIAEGRLTRYSMGPRILVFDPAEVRGLQKKPRGRPKQTQDQREDMATWLSYGILAEWMLKCPPSIMKGPCLACGQQVGTVIPRGGNGVARVAIKHKPVVPIRMKLASGQVVEAQCPGSHKAPKGWRQA